MDTVVIILGTIVVVLVIYLIYAKYFAGVSTLLKQVSLTTRPPSIVATSIQKGDSTRFAYGIWVYINQWTPGQKLIFARGSEIAVYLDTEAKLICILNPTKIPDGIAPDADKPNGNTDEKKQKTITVSNNFPLQKWVYITVSVDNTIADIYLEGKMVKSVPIPQVSPDADKEIVFGGNYQAYISQFQRWTTEIDPQTVWSTYMKSSGGNGVSMGNYNVNLSLLKDNAVASNFSLF
jgi:hypothetical protein